MNFWFIYCGDELWYVIDFNIKEELYFNLFDIKYGIV